MALANGKLIPTQKHCVNLLVCTRPNGRNSPTTFLDVQGLAEGLCRDSAAARVTGCNSTASTPTLGAVRGSQEVLLRTLFWCRFSSCIRAPTRSPLLAVFIE